MRRNFVFVALLVVSLAFSSFPAFQVQGSKSPWRMGTEESGSLTIEGTEESGSFSIEGTEVSGSSSIEGKELVVTDNPAEVALSTDEADSNHTSPLTVDTETGQVENNRGEKLSMDQAFDMSSEKKDELLSKKGKKKKKKEIADYIKNTEVCNIDDSQEDQLTVSFPYVYKRLYVFAPEGRLENTYGATSVSYFTPAGDYILDYASEEAAKEACEKLEADMGSEAVLPDYPVYGKSQSFTETTALSNSWGTDLMHLDLVRDQINADSSVTQTATVAVLDTGVYSDHELFTNRIADGGKSFVNETTGRGSNRQTITGIDDLSGHGTHVAGIVADGSPDQVKILPVKILNKKEEGGFGEVINGIYYAVNQGADVINLSLGIYFDRDPATDPDYAEDYQNMETALKKAWNSGCICVCAAGNQEGRESRDLAYNYGYPAISSYTLAISSIGSDKSLASSSYYGSKIDFTAPGEDIVSAGIDSTSSYLTLSGTSMAAPNVAAACGVLSLYNSKISNAGIKNALAQLCEDLGTTGKDKYYGYGLINFGDGDVPLITEDSSSGTTESDSDPDSDSGVDAQTASVKKGQTYKVSGSSYKVSKVASGSTAGSVTLTQGKNKKSLTIPSAIKLTDGKSYKVTATAANAFTGSKIQTVTLNGNIQTLKAKTFKGSKTTKVILKTKKLTKSSVKGSMTSSKVKYVVVKLSGSGVKKSYVKKYKKYFTKANCGKKVAVK